MEAEGELSKRTLHDYRYNLTRHVLPSIGAVKVMDITPRTVKTLIREKRAEGYAKNTVRLMRAALSVVLSEAVEDGLLQVNPAISKGGRRKRQGTMTKSERLQKIRPMTWRQREQFLRAAHEFDPIYGVLFELIVKTGLRPGEAMALQVDDIDLRARRIRVERAVSMREVKTTKTSEARDVDLSTELVGILESYIPQLRAEAMRHGWELTWLFPSETNTPRDQSHVSKAYRRILRRAGLPAFRLYDLRHTAASLLLARCAPITYVAAQLGHAKPTTTLAFLRAPHSDGRGVVRRLAGLGSSPSWHQNRIG